RTSAPSRTGFACVPTLPAADPARSSARRSGIDPPDHRNRCLDELDVDDLGVLVDRGRRGQLPVRAFIPARAPGHRPNGAAERAAELRGAHRDHGAVAEVEIGLADRLVGEVERARVDRGPDEPLETGVRIQLEGEERVVAGAAALLPAVRLRRWWQDVR